MADDDIGRDSPDGGAALLSWVACLTAPGRGAIATLAVHGPQAWEMLAPYFRPASGGVLPSTPEPGRFWLGRLGEKFADEVVLAVKSMQCLELHCHGGREVVRMLLELINKQGAPIVSWSEHIARTHDDPLQAAAATALARATTTRSAAILLDQYSGALSKALHQIRAALRENALAEAKRMLRELSRHDGLGRRLTTPWRVVIAGAPNVGKSSLANALAGYQRSIVAPTPGTTRDVVTTRLAIDGYEIELADTAGLRREVGALEGQGIEQARGSLRRADCVLWVVDAATDPVWPDASVPDVRLVLNKIDLPPAWDTALVEDAVRVSATTGDGIAGLCANLSSWLVPDPPAAETAVPFTPEICDAVVKALRLLEAGNLEACEQVLNV